MPIAEVNLKKIKQLRETQGKSMEYMAKILGYETATGYCYLESGRVKIKANQLFVIAQELGVTVEELYFFKQVPTILVASP